MNAALRISAMVGLVALNIQVMAQWPADSTARITVCQAPGPQQYPRLVSDGSGGAIVVWEDGRAGSTRIFAQRIDSAGVLQWATDGIQICTADGSQRPRLVSDGAGGAIITWWDMRAGWPNGSVCAQRVDGSGAIKWAQNGVVLDSVANSVAFPVIAAYDTGAVIAWHGVDGEPWIQKIDTAGVIQWAPGGVQVALRGDNPMSIFGEVDAGGSSLLGRNMMSTTSTRRSTPAISMRPVMWPLRRPTVPSSVTGPRHRSFLIVCLTVMAARSSGGMTRVMQITIRMPSAMPRMDPCNGPRGGRPAG